MNVRQRICGLAMILTLFAVAGIGQDKKREAQLRTVRDVVSDKSDSPLSGSVVILQNVSTNSVRSSQTDDTGSYRFYGLETNANLSHYTDIAATYSRTLTVTSIYISTD